MQRISRRALLAGAGSVLAAQDGRGLPRPTAGQRAWQNFELGIVFHYDLPVFAPQGWKPVQSTLDPNLYQPKKLDTDQWLESAQAMGCRYAIFTATHFNGFLQWQSDLYPYGLKQTSWRGGKGDVFGDFVKSCHKYKIAPGVYLSCHRNAYQKAWGHRVNWGKGGDGQAEFAKLGAQMTEELVSRYGPMCEVWYDAGIPAPDDGGPDVVPVIDRHQKQTVFYHSPQRREHRWIGNEAGHAGDPCWATMPDLAVAEKAHKQSAEYRAMLYHGDPNGKLWSPAMVDVPIRNHDWFWVPDSDHKVYAVEKLVEMYYRSVGRNSNLILGGTPNRDGLIPDADVKAYKGLGTEIRRRFGKALAKTAGWKSELELPLPRPSRIDHVQLMEDIADGERIRKFIVEGLRPGGEWVPLSTGQSVGHKRIDRFPAIEVAKVRLRCTEVAAPPHIHELAVFAAL